MNIQATYDYLRRARLDLWRCLENLPDEVLNRPLLNGPRFRCIKDLLFHLAEVEDGWIQGDIQGKPMAQDAFPELKAGGPDFAGFTLETLLAYWRVVERHTLAYLSSLTDAELSRAVVVSESPETRHTVDGLLWHVLIHEMRHTAQIVVLLRAAGFEPPSLDLLFYLPEV